MASESKTAIVMIGLLATVGARACRATATHGDDVVRAVRHADDIPVPHARPKAPAPPEAPSRAVGEEAALEPSRALTHAVDAADAGLDVASELGDEEEVASPTTTVP